VKAEDAIKARLDALLVLGDQVLATRQSYGPGIIAGDYVDSALASQWATSCQSFLSRVFGRESDHYLAFSKEIERGIAFSNAKRAQGVMRAAEDDLSAGALFQVRALIEAEVFDDFLEQAEALHKAGYYQPAAVVAGAVLEDGLRSLCTTNSITIPSRPKLDTMNSDLAKAGVYSKLVQKKITTLADLRNKAAHGQWDEFDAEDVEEMLAQVRRFMSDFVA